MKWIVILLFLTGCTYQSYNKERYKSWYNKKESNSAKKEGRSPDYIDRRNLF